MCIELFTKAIIVIFLALSDGGASVATPPWMKPYNLMSKTDVATLIEGDVYSTEHLFKCTKILEYILARWDSSCPSLLNASPF